MFITSVVLAAEADTPETVTLQLKWKHAFQFAGYYAAIEQGYYTAAGLNVLLREHEGDRTPAEVMLDGDAEYAVTGSHIVLNHAKGQPVMALAAIFQHSPYAFLVTDNSGIKRIEDFRGKRIMLFGKGEQDAELLAAMRRAGLNNDDYISLKTSFDAFSLVRGETDVFNAYVSDQGHTLEEAGIKNHYILPQQYGVDFYGDVLVTTEDEVRFHGQRVQSFLQASLLGWDYALRHPDEIIELILHKYNTQHLSHDHLAYEARSYRELIQPLLVKIGYMNPERWKNIRDIFAELGFLDTDSNIEGMLYQRETKPANTLQWFADNRLTLIAVSVIVLVLILLLFTFQLRRLVKKRTEDLLESEQHMRALINAEPACVKTISRAGELLSMNSAGLAMIDAVDFEQVRGARVTDLVDREYQEDFLKLNKQVFAGQSGSLLFKAKGLAGREVWLETTAVPFTDAKGNITRQLAVTQDVTERIRSEKERERLQHELQIAQKMEALGHLAGGIAHDFNNLLGIIIGFSRMSLSRSVSGDDPKLPNYLNNVIDAAERATALVAQMTAFSRNETSSDETMQLHLPAQEDIKLLRSALPSSITIKSDIRDDLPAVKLNATQLNQILLNLSINARDAMNGKGVLSIRLDLQTGLNNYCSACHKHLKGDWVELSVTDTGTGIPADVINNIFNPFFSTKDIGKGSGMGLAVIYGIAHNNDGHILVETKPGKGTSFRVLFPPAEVSGLRHHDADSDTAAIPQGNGEHILVVDDEVALTSFISELLNDNGYQLTVINNSVDAAKLLEAHAIKYSLLITDQTMPALSGLDLIRIARQQRGDLPVILCSGYSEEINENTISELDIEFLKKPVDINRLLELVHHAVSKPGMQAPHSIYANKH